MHVFSSLRSKPLVRNSMEFSPSEKSRAHDYISLCFCETDPRLPCSSCIGICIPRAPRLLGVKEPGELPLQGRASPPRAEDTRIPKSTCLVSSSDLDLPALQELLASGALFLYQQYLWGYPEGTRVSSETDRSPLGVTAASPGTKVPPPQSSACQRCVLCGGDGGEQTFETHCYSSLASEPLRLSVSQVEALVWTCRVSTAGMRPAPQAGPPQTSECLQLQPQKGS